MLNDEREWIEGLREGSQKVVNNSIQEKNIIIEAMDKVFRLIGTKSPTEMQTAADNGQLKNFKEICDEILGILLKIKVSLEIIEKDAAFSVKVYNQLDDKNKRKSESSYHQIKKDYKRIKTEIEDYIDYWIKTKKEGKIAKGALFFGSTRRKADTSVREYIRKILSEDEKVNKDMLQFIGLVHTQKYSTT